MLATWDCVAALYGAARAEGSRRAKREPAMRVAGYIASMMVSREVGSSGGRRDDIFAGAEAVAPRLDAVDSGDKFWIL